MVNAKTVNWSMLDRTILYRYFYALNTRVVGKNIKIDNLHKMMSRHIKRSVPVKVLRSTNNGIEKTEIALGGTYSGEDDKKNKTSIELIFKYHPEAETIRMTNYAWKKLSVLFADTILHEIVHMRQFRARNFKEIPGYKSAAASARERQEQEYLGDRDEMGAFAFNVACETIDRFGYEPQTIKRYLDGNSSKRHKNSAWHNYMNAFDWNHNHLIIKRMKRKILSQLENAHNGKPFKTSDWLTY